MPVLGLVRFQLPMAGFGCCWLRARACVNVVCVCVCVCVCVRARARLSIADEIVIKSP